MSIMGSEGPHHIKAMNYTEMVPQGFQHKLTHNQATMLRFRNTELYMNCTRDMDVDVSAEEGYNQKMLRLHIETRNALHLEMQLRESKPTGIDEPGKHLGFYCELEPNATITEARLGMEVDPSQAQARNMEMEQLTWAYWNGEAWAPVDSTLSDENVLETTTDHFSTWAIIQVEETEPETTTGIPIPTIFIAIGISAALLLFRKNQIGFSP